MISDILDVTKSNSPQRCTSGTCVLQNVPKSKYPQIKMSPNWSKRLQLKITGEISRNLIIFFKIQVERGVRRCVYESLHYSVCHDESIIPAW